MALNVLAPMRLTHHFGNHFVKRGSGVIINIDSVAGINPMGPQAAYVASKHAITGWTESVAQVQLTEQTEGLPHFTLTFASVCATLFMVVPDKLGRFLC